MELGLASMFWGGVIYFAADITRQVRLHGGVRDGDKHETKEGEDASGARALIRDVCVGHSTSAINPPSTYKDAINAHCTIATLSPSTTTTTTATRPHTDTFAHSYSNMGTTSISNSNNRTVHTGAHIDASSFEGVDERLYDHNVHVDVTADDERGHVGEVPASSTHATPPHSAPLIPSVTPPPPPRDPRFGWGCLWQKKKDQQQYHYRGPDPESLGLICKREGVRVLFIAEIELILSALVKNPEVGPSEIYDTHKCALDQVMPRGRSRAQKVERVRNFLRAENLTLSRLITDHHYPSCRHTHADATAHGATTRDDVSDTHRGHIHTDVTGRTIHRGVSDAHADVRRGVMNALTHALETRRGGGGGGGGFVKGGKAYEMLKRYWEHVRAALVACGAVEVDRRSKRPLTQMEIEKMKGDLHDLQPDAYPDAWGKTAPLMSPSSQTLAADTQLARLLHLRQKFEAIAHNHWCQRSHDITDFELAYAVAKRDREAKATVQSARDFATSKHCTQDGLRRWAYEGSVEAALRCPEAMRVVDFFVKDDGVIHRCESPTEAASILAALDPGHVSDRWLCVYAVALCGTVLQAAEQGRAYADMTIAEAERQTVRAIESRIHALTWLLERTEAQERSGSGRVVFVYVGSGRGKRPEQHLTEGQSGTATLGPLLQMTKWCEKNRQRHLCRTRIYLHDLGSGDDDDVTRTHTHTPKKILTHTSKKIYTHTHTHTHASRVLEALYLELLGGVGERGGRWIINAKAVADCGECAVSSRRKRVRRDLGGSDSDDEGRPPSWQRLEDHSGGDDDIICIDV